MSAHSSNSRDSTNNASSPASDLNSVADQVSTMNISPSLRFRAHFIDSIDGTAWVGRPKEGPVDINFTCSEPSARPGFVIVCPYIESLAPTEAERIELPVLSKGDRTSKGQPVLVVHGPEGRIHSFVNRDLPQSQWIVPDRKYGQDEYGRERNGQDLKWWPMKVAEITLADLDSVDVDE
jgi:hypothetical protein